jgi:hypothetical protein
VHGASSSTGLVAAAFAPWRTDPGSLRIAGLGGFEAVRLEERLLIPHGGGTPNLDVALPLADGGFAGVEAKLTEHLASRTPRPWPRAYRRPAMAAALAGGWAEVFADLLEGRWVPRHLDAPQLVRHALSLQATAASRPTYLVLLFWEPLDGDGVPEVVAHRDEVAELLDRLGPGASPQLRALSWAELWDTWARTRPDHVAALRRRYAVCVGDG